ncbi:MAG: DUF2309 domain-containing protein [Pseudomonadota bacterium]|nr:DUF2309 domain-containing protein [Pseudomonadota bacterium]
MTPLLTTDLTRPAATGARRPQTELLIALAARAVPPLWPLDGAIAVNPLAGLEDQPFEVALREGARLFSARAALPLPLWRRLVAAGVVDRQQVQQVAVERLGGFTAAFELLGPNVTLVDCVMARAFDLPVVPEPTDREDPVAALIAKWCGAFFDRGQAGAALSGREGGLWRAVTALLRHDVDFVGLGPDAVPLLDAASADPVVAVAESLDALGVAASDRRDVLTRLVARLPGWAGHIRWRLNHADPADRVEAPATMADLLALWLLMERASPPMAAATPAPRQLAVELALARHFTFNPADGGPALAQAAGIDEAELGLMFQIAAERGYRDRLLADLPLAEAQMNAVTARPDTQLVFCIDVRSEPIRRAIEAEGHHDTYGYAGFFGLPIAIHPPGEPRVRQLPVLVAPQHDLALAPVAGRAEDARRERRARTRAHAAADLFANLKTGSATTFTTAEAAGPLSAALMMLNTLLPKVAARIGARWRGAGTALAPSLHATEGGCGGLTLAEQVGYARALFSLTGLSRSTARLVVLTGHRGATVNNPYAAALDCGACAGHGGAPNARVLARILNDPEVQTLLADDGALPDDTWFIAGEHNTTTDAVTLFDLHLLPHSHHADLARLQAALGRAGETTRQARASFLRRPAGDCAIAASHWGEVRPEWGLTGNASFIVARRALTRDVDLGGRAFLHSYDWRTDGSGEALATILTAPMVVAQWINCQYLFSTIDNRRYGAGDKTVHNPIGRLGVVRGNDGDLCVGLPYQSLFHDDGTPAHIPQRLLTIVEAPLARVKAVVEGHASLRRLFGGGWVHLVVIDPETGKRRCWLSDTAFDDQKETKA